MHTASYEFLMEPKESAGCHQTLSMRVGSGDETNPNLLCLCPSVAQNYVHNSLSMNILNCNEYCTSDVIQNPQVLGTSQGIKQGLKDVYVQTHCNFVPALCKNFLEDPTCVGLCVCVYVCVCVCAGN